MRTSRPVAFAALAATALIGVLALSYLGGDEEEEQQEEGSKVEEEEDSVNKLPKEAAQLFEIAVALGKRGDYDQAEKIMRKVLEITERQFGLTHAAVGEILGNIGMLLQAQQKTDDAELMFR
jgi:tetratricopeptide (TPR) repeat protein